MTTEMRQCRQCGEIKVMDQFRKYYGDRKGHYRVCKQCEKVNQRYKYLTRKANLTPTEQYEVNKIKILYDILRRRGLRPPGTTERESDINLDEMISTQLQRIEELSKLVPEDLISAPQELLEWLNKDLAGLEDWELEDILDNLEDKYRPQLGVDAQYKPVFDDTYRDILERIRERFGL